MASYNKVLLMGNLTRDVELKHIAGNQAVAEIGLAVNRSFKTKDGEDREETTFVDCEAWGRTAEVMKQYLSKGRPVFIEGRLKLDQWTDKDGQKRSKMRVVIESFQFVGGPAGSGVGGGGGGSGASAPGRTAAPTRSAHSAGEEHTPTAEEDIPF
ncbi:MAG: single-stranded DNA-binding protein [Phycisphaerales bacterium]|nr:single-stranded DNA-binding protein [Phycisphaerales bacterium]